MFRRDLILFLSLFFGDNQITSAYNNNTTSDYDTYTYEAPTVAVIGCGPSGIGFLHAINLKRKQMEDEGDFDGLSNLPIATCFERSSEPGGVWRAQTDHSCPEDNRSCSEDNSNTTHGESTQMYEALWTNGPKELFEFFDYTHEDHFDQSLPAFLPRELVLEYILTRVQRNTGDFFEHANFNTNVDFVKFNEASKKFEVTVNDGILRTRSILHFDKCIWAAGINGMKQIPQSVDAVLRGGNYRGTVMHSSAAGEFLSEAKGKRVLMIGDSYSAEDLTLQALKLGVKTVYILSRSGNGVCVGTSSWPGEVHLLEDMALTKVTKGGTGITLSQMEYNITDGTHTYPVDGVSIDLTDISAVIYCTGYDVDLSMLDGPLQDAFTEYDEKKYALKDYLKSSDVSKTWTMSPNSLTETLGDVEPADNIDSWQIGVIPGLYRGLLISNPSMMFMLDGAAEFPLWELDVQAWLLLAFLTDDLNIPSEDKMIQRNTQSVADYMQQPTLRFMMDPNYQTAWWDYIADDDDRYDALNADASRFNMKNFAQQMQDASYPTNIGTAEELNETGELVLKMHLQQDNSRYQTDPSSAESAWKTFRDCDPSSYVSLYTGRTAARFEKNWVDIDEKELTRNVTINLFGWQSIS